MAKTFDAKGAARRAMADISRTAKTFTQENLYRFVLVFVSYIFLELESAQKSLYHDLSKADYLKIVTSMVKRSNYLAKELTDYAALRSCLNDIYELMWKLANEDEARYIINRLEANDKPFAQHFFYGSGTREPNIDLIRTKINFDMQKTYCQRIDPYELSQLLYLHLMKDNWAALKTFGYQGSIYSWLEEIGRHELSAQLTKLGYTNHKPKERTPGNTRIKGMKKADPDKALYIIDECVQSKRYRSILYLVYVEKLSQEEAAIKAALSLEAFQVEFKEACRRLRDGILRSQYNFDDVLSDKQPRLLKATPDYAAGLAQWLSTTMRSDYTDVFGVNASDDEIEARCVEVLESVMAHMPWSERDRYIFAQRQAGRPSLELAEELGLSNGYIDMHYSRLRARFQKALRQWWEEWYNGRKIK